MSQFSIESGLSHSTEKLRSETFCVSEKSWYRKTFIAKRSGRGDVMIRNRKLIWQDRDSNPGPTDPDPCCPNPTAFIYF